MKKKAIQKTDKGKYFFRKKSEFIIACGKSDRNSNFRLGDISRKIK